MHVKASLALASATLVLLAAFAPIAAAEFPRMRAQAGAAGAPIAIYTCEAFNESSPGTGGGTC